MFAADRGQLRQMAEELTRRFWEEARLEWKPSELGGDGFRDARTLRCLRLARVKPTEFVVSSMIRDPRCWSINDGGDDDRN